MKRTLFYLVFLFSLVSLSNAQNINRPNIEGPGNLQVNSYTGGLFYKRTDLHIPGKGQPIDLTFYYNSYNTEIDHGFGRGWSMTYSMLCRPEGSNVIVRHKDGRKDIYVLSGSTYVAPPGIFDELVQYGPGQFRLTDKSGNEYLFADPYHSRLTSMVDPNGNTLNISYTDSFPTMITDVSGRSVHLNYLSKHLVNVTDPNSTPVKSINYSNNADGSPVSVSDAVGNSHQYVYDKLQNMTQVTDRNSNQFNVIYDACVRVATINSPLNSIQLAYDTTAKLTTMTQMVNSVMQTTTYDYDLNGNLVEKMSACCGYHEIYQYDPLRNLIQKTDANGSSWNYTYDPQGNMLQETDPFGNTIINTYDPVYNKVLSTKDKRGFFTNYTYDPNGNLLQVQHPLGITESYGYDPFGNIISYTDGRGNTTTYLVNPFGYITQANYPDGSTNQWSYSNTGERLSFTNGNLQTTQYIYDPLERLIQKIDPLGNPTSYSYDANGNLIATTDALGRTTNTIYDALDRPVTFSTPKGTSNAILDEKGNALSVTDPLGQVTTYTYNAQNLVSSETNAAGNTRNFGYDANGNRTIETDFNANITTYTYDALNRLTQVTDPLTHTTIYGYDQNGNKTSETDGNSNTTNYSYDALNRLTSVQRPIGTTSYTYDGNGNKLTELNANGNTTSYSYDAMNRVIQVTDPLGQSIFNSYDFNGNQISTTDRNGLTTNYSYDANGRILTETNAAGETTSSSYDPVGNKITMSLPNGNIISYNFDAGDRITSISDLMGISGSATFNAVDNITSQTDGVGNTVFHSYDNLNRRITTNYPDGTLTTYTYDNNSNLLSVIDRNGSTTSYSYDPMNRRLSITSPQGNVTSHTYDNVGNIKTLTDDNSNTTTYSYDGNNRLVSQSLANGSIRFYNYDPFGNRTSIVDYNGAITNYSYDALNRLIVRNYPGPNDDLFTYDPGGRVITANNLNANILFSYDNANRMLFENRNGRITSYNYNIPASKTTITYPGGRMIEEEMDLRYNLSVVRDGGLPLSSFSYDNANRLISRNNINNTLTTYTYNTNNSVTSIDHSRFGIPFAHFDYSFDAEGNRMTASKAHRPTNSEQYSYDLDYRNNQYKEGTLVGPNIPAPLTQTTFSYDGAANRISSIKDGVPTNYTSNNVNQYTNIVELASVNPNYDLNGNMIFDGTNNYQYDSQNHIVSVNGGLTAQYRYDALGRRVQKVSSGGTINYYYDGQRVIEERDAANVLIATYVYGNKIDELLSMTRTGNVFHYHMNSLGSVVAVTNNAGNVAERYEYDSFGRVSFFNPGFGSIPATTIGNRILFTGREYDVETQTYYYRARNYISKWGRFMQRDPLEYIDGVNMYDYVQGNPQNRLDPFGLATCKEKDLGCITISKDKTFFDVDNVPLGVLGPFVIKGSLNISGKFESKDCTKCCTNCSIRAWGYKKLSLTADAGISATTGWYVFTLELYGKLHAEGSGTLEYDLCKKPKGKLCVDVSGSITVGVRATADVWLAEAYAGGEGTGTCSTTVCLDSADGMSYSSPKCSLSGRIYVGLSSAFGSKEWDIWSSN